VSADRLSPERGSYGFAQNMLRQVAYDTLSRRDRKTRHLAVAAHLRAAFAGDGEEVADVIARHYLDALNAVPDDGDANLHIVVVPIVLGRGERLWDGLEGLEDRFQIEAVNSPSGVTHVTLSRR
jgi:hypothetical protein